MRRIDELHLDYPFAGSRMLRDLLQPRGRRDRPPARRDADEAHGHRGDLSPAEHVASRRRATRSIRICCAAWRSSGPTRCGRWTSPTSRWRAASSIWRRSSTGSAAGFCRIACRSRWRSSSASRRSRRRSAKHGRPEIFNTDQGSQFTSADFTGVLLEATASRSAWTARARGATTSSSSGSGASVKYEEVYLRAYDSVGEARASIGRYLDFYNRRRPHSSLDRRTPDEAYFDQPAAERRQHEFRRRCWGVTPVGLRPPCVAPQSAHPHQTNPAGTPLIFRGNLFRQPEPALIYGLYATIVPLVAYALFGPSRILVLGPTHRWPLSSSVSSAHCLPETLIALLP